MNRTTAMRNCLRVCLIVGCAAFLTSCAKKEESSRAAAAELERVFQAKTPEPKPATLPSPPSSTPAARGDQVKEAVAQAVTAIRTNGYAEAFFTLHAIQAAPSLTLNQYSAIENARLALERDMAAKAAGGDPVALKALRQINQSGH